MDFAPIDSLVNLGDRHLEGPELWASLVTESGKEYTDLVESLTTLKTFKEALANEDFIKAAGPRIYKGRFYYLGRNVDTLLEMDIIEGCCNDIFYDLSHDDRKEMHKAWVEYVNLVRKTTNDPDYQVRLLGEFNTHDWRNTLRSLRTKTTLFQPSGSSKGVGKEKKKDVPMNEGYVKTYLAKLRQDPVVQNPNADKDFVDFMKQPRDLKVVSDFAQNMGKMSIKDFMEIIHSFEYEGFDPYTTFYQLRAYGSDLNDNDFRVDMTLCCILFLMRGTSIVSAKKMEKMSPDGKTIVQKLQTKYQIEPKLGERSTKRTITLSRIAATFPQAAVSYLNQAQCSIGRPVSIGDMTKTFPEYPCCMRTSCFFALIPREKKYVPYIMALLHHQLLEAMIINRNAKTKGKPIAMESVLVYSKSAFDSKITEEDSHRKKMFKIHGPNLSDEILEQWRAAFTSLYPDLDIESEFGLN